MKQRTGTGDEIGKQEDNSFKIEISNQLLSTTNFHFLSNLYETAI
jgi:hypothetical protein